MFAVFLPRVKPASHRAKPGCMKNTSIAASNIHTVSNDIAKSCTLIILKFLIVKNFFRQTDIPGSPGSCAACPTRFLHSLYI